MSRLLEWLPAQWQEGREGVYPITLRLMRGADGGYQLERNGVLEDGLALEDAIRLYEWSLRNHLAATAPEHVFVHSAVAAHRGKAILVPGPSFSGKSMLVSELVKAGASYYSDEYAVIDANGLVHPFAKPISLRTDDTPRRRFNHHAASLGAAIGTEPIRIGLVVATQYRSDAVWDPVELSPAESLLVLLQQSRTPEDRRATTLETLSRALVRTTGLSGDRGDASGMAASLLGRLEASAAV